MWGKFTLPTRIYCLNKRRNLWNYIRHSCKAFEPCSNLCIQHCIPYRKQLQSFSCISCNHHYFESNSDVQIKEMVQSRIQPSYALALKYLDSHRDRQIVEAFLAEPTNTSFADRMQGLQSRKGTRAAVIAFKSNLHKYESIRSSLQVVRNGMTN